MNRKGLVNQIMIILILFIVFALLIGGYFIVSLAAPIVVGEGITVLNQVKTSVTNQEPEGSGLTNATTVAIDTSTGVLGIMNLFVYFGLIGLVIGFILIAYYVRTYPFLMGFWIFGVIFFAVFAMILSNAYQQASAESSLSGDYSAWGMNDYIMTFLPHIIVFIGILGGIFLFALISREPESEVNPL